MNNGSGEISQGNFRKADIWEKRQTSSTYLDKGIRGSNGWNMLAVTLMTG